MANSAHLDRLVRHHVREARLEALHEGRHLESIRSPLGEDARREPRARPPRETTTKTECVRRSEEVTTRTRTPRERDAAARPEARASPSRDAPPYAPRVRRTRPPVGEGYGSPLRPRGTRQLRYAVVYSTHQPRTRGQMLQISRLWVHHPVGPANAPPERRLLRGTVFARHLARHHVISFVSYCIITH